MIQNIKLHSQSKSVPTQSLPIRTSQSSQPSQTPPAETSNPVKNIASSSLSMYEQTQRRLKDQILTVQRHSRAMKSQEKTILYQGLGAFGASFILVVLFIFFIVPLLIRFAGNLSSISVFPQTDVIPPTVPVFSALPQAIQENTLEISGYAEAKSQVVGVKNGSENTRVEANDKGEFKINVALDDGENKISLYSVDASNNESSLSKEHIVLYDIEDPELEWEAPEDQKTIRNLREQSIEVKGKVNEAAKVTLNDRQLSLSSENTFSTQFRLENGENKLKLKVIDLAGNEIEQERTIFFKP
jgi:hypothetical protein